MLVSQQLNSLYFASLYRNCIQFLPAETLAPQFEYRSFIKDAVQRTQKSIDEWLLHPLKETEDRDLLEIVESRYKRNSTIFCSQFDIPGWPEKLSDPLLADAICDRIVHDAYTVVIGGKESMRKRKGLQDI